MSVAAMTLDDQRPLMNSYDKMSKQYEQNLHGGVGGITSNGGGVGSVGIVGAPPSGPASPTPSEDLQQQQFQHTHQQQQQQQPHHAHHHHDNQNAIAEAVAAAEQRQRLLEEEIDNLKVEQTRLSQQCADAQRREKILIRRLANKEQEFQDYVSQIAEYKAAQAPTALALRSALLDPAVNLLFEKLKKELKATKAKLEETQNELSAWKFTPDSNTGKRLMAKCRLLYQENEELGKMTSNGRLAKLETELAMQKSFSEVVKKSQDELDDFLQELDEDVEGMQSTILFLQQELKTTRDRIQLLEKENTLLKSGNNEAIDIKMECGENNADDAGEQTMQLDAAGGLNGGDGAEGESKDLSAINLTTYSSHQVQQQQQQQQQQLNNAININEIKYQATTTTTTTSKLETIDENTLLRSTHNVVVNSGAVDYSYNNVEEQMQHGGGVAAAAAAGVAEECSDGSNNSTNGSKLRVAAVPRKRSYENGPMNMGLAADANDVNNSVLINTTTTAATTVLTATHVIAPRTLPPKKSKLRVVTPPVQQRSAELNENEINFAPQIMLGGNSSGVVVVAGTPTVDIVDNAVAGMANEETPDEAMDVGGGVAQRIMTRRRSVRMQQNGAAAGGNDSNH